MSMGNLQAAIEQATSKTHVREFEVGGQLLTFPRLSIGDQGAFETYVRETSDKDATPFSLAATRNKASMVMGSVITRAKRQLEEEILKRGESLVAQTEGQARAWADKLQDDVMNRFSPYVDRIFGGINRGQMLSGVARSMVAANGKTVTYNVKNDETGELEPVTMPIDAAFVDKLFSGEPGRVLEDVFLWVVGLNEQIPGSKASLKPGMTLDDIVKKSVGDAENSEREQDIA